MVSFFWVFRGWIIIDNMVSTSLFFSAFFSMKLYKTLFFDPTIHKLFFSTDIRMDVVENLKYNRSLTRIILFLANHGRSGVIL